MGLAMGFLCVVLALINLPGVMDGNLISIAGFIVCLFCSVANVAIWLRYR